MEVPHLCLQGFQGISSFLEEEYYDVQTEFEDDSRRNPRFLLIYGFISVLAFFILFSLLVACYYHFKHLFTIRSDSSDSSEAESIEVRSNTEQSIGTDNISTSEGNKLSNESIYNSNTEVASCSKAYISKTKDGKLRDSVKFIRETDYYQSISPGAVMSPFSRQNVLNTSSKNSKICASKTFSSGYSSKKDYSYKDQILDTHPEFATNNSSEASYDSCKYHNLPLTEGGISKFSADEHCNISFGDNNGFQSSSSEINISALFLSSEDISSTSESEMLTIQTDVDINETCSETDLKEF